MGKHQRQATPSPQPVRSLSQAAAVSIYRRLVCLSSNLSKRLTQCLALQHLLEFLSELVVVQDLE